MRKQVIYSYILDPQRTCYQDKKDDVWITMEPCFWFVGQNLTH